MRMIDRVRRFRSEVAGVARHAGLGVAARFVGAALLASPEVLRSGSLAAADRKVRGRDMRVRISGGQPLRVPVRYFGGMRELCCRQVYDRGGRFAARAGDQVVDLGANVGLFSCISAARGARVLAVEAQRGFLPSIAELASSNGLADRVTVVWGLVGAESGLLSQAESRACASHMDGAEPPRLDLAELLRRENIAKIDLLKVDIEGSEFALFSGDAPWLDAVSRVVMEVHAEFGAPAALRAVLERRGFAVEMLDEQLAPVPANRAVSGFLYARRS